MFKLPIKKVRDPQGKPQWQTLIVTCGNETVRLRVQSTSPRALWFESDTNTHDIQFSVVTENADNCQ